MEGLHRTGLADALWHLTAVLVTLLTARLVGVTLPDVGTAAWWWTRPLWFVVLAVPTAALVAIFLRFDHGTPGPTSAVDRPRAWFDPVAGIGAFVTFFGILMVSIVGVDVLGNRPAYFLVADVTPTIAFAVFPVGVGLILLTRRPVRRRTRRADVTHAASRGPALVHRPGTDA